MNEPPHQDCGSYAERKSGIWQGSTEVELRQLERQWDDYKVSHTAALSYDTLLTRLHLPLLPELYVHARQVDPQMPQCTDQSWV